jgi:hemerythrin-like domain-containing protein
MNQPDVTMMYAVHNAFRRDLARMRSVADVKRPAVHQAIADCWTTFHRYLTIHHTAEDEMLWPPMRTKVSGQGRDERLLDQMVDEHIALDPVLTEIDSALQQGSSARLKSLFADLSDVLGNHFEHEETAVLPLVRQTLSTREWDAFGADQRRRVGFRGAAWFFPWLLDEAPQDIRDFVLSLVPPPVRLVHWVLWEPRYRRVSPWQ